MGFTMKRVHGLSFCCFGLVTRNARKRSIVADRLADQDQRIGLEGCFDALTIRPQTFDLVAAIIGFDPADLPPSALSLSSSAWRGCHVSMATLQRGLAAAAPTT